MQISTWADLLRELDAALGFIRSLGLADWLDGSRFVAFRNRIAELTTIHERDGDAAAFREFAQDAELNGTALAEAHEIVTVVPYLRSAPDRKNVQMKLKLVLRGPERPQDESGSSNAPRNTMFELNVAARLQRSGLSLDPRGDEDVRFAYGGIIWVGECKRPYDLHTIPTNLSRAFEQINTRLRAESLAARGLIAVSLARPLAVRMPFLEYGRWEELRSILSDRVGEMVRLMADQLKEVRPYRPGHVGLLMTHIVMPAWDHSERIPTTVQYSVGTDTCEDGSRDGERLWGAISSTFDKGVT